MLLILRQFYVVSKRYIVKVLDRSGFNNAMDIGEVTGAILRVSDKVKVVREISLD